MNIKTWQEREGVPADTQGHTLDHCVTPAMQAEIDELRAALKAQPVQEPVAILHDDGYWTRINTPAGRAFADKRPLPTTKVYAAPVQPMQPAITTDDACEVLSTVLHFIPVSESKLYQDVSRLCHSLREAQPVQKPTDLIKRLRETASKGVSVWGDLQMEADKEIEVLTAEREAYASAMDRMKAAPVQPAPLTDDEIWEMAANCLEGHFGRLHFARAIEARVRTGGAG